MVSDIYFPPPLAPIHPLSHSLYPSKYPHPYVSRNHPALSYPIQYRAPAARGPRCSHYSNPASLLNLPQRSSAPYYYNQTSNASLVPNNRLDASQRFYPNNNNTSLNQLFAESNIYKAQPYRPHSAVEAPVQSYNFARYPRRPSSVMPIVTDNEGKACGVEGCACSISSGLPRLTLASHSRSMSEPPVEKTDEDPSDAESDASSATNNNNDAHFQNNNVSSQTNVSQSGGPVVEQYLGYV